MNSASAPALARGSLRWYWNRMRVMNPLELPHRAATAVGGLKDLTLDRLGMLAPAPRKCMVFPAAWMAGANELPHLQAVPFLCEADAIASGRIACVDGSTFVLGAPADWNGVTRTSPHANPLDDVRFQMELHRHGHLVRLAQAWRLGSDRLHLDALLQQLESWFAQCPYPRGVGWASALDAGLRLLNWSLVWQLLQADRPDSVVPDALRQRWLASVYVHARFVRQNRSRHSSANNHLLGELLGLMVADTTWPVWQQLGSWASSARREFVLEALSQTHEDGANCEQASWYQAFVFELLAVFVCIEAAQGRSIDERLRQRMGAMAGFVAALRDCKGQLSHHGDADHTRVLYLDPQPVAAEPYGRMLALAVDLGMAPGLHSMVDEPSAITPWLLGAAAAARPERKDPQAARASLPRAFPQGGYHLLGSHFGKPDEVLMTVDTGSLGYLSIAAHGHADALSLRLSVGGQPVLVDRGTYTYNGEPARRRFFRSTLAHNTVCVDDTDQSIYGGPFLWLRHASTHVDSFVSGDAAGHVDATHDGYQLLRRPLTHRRRVEWHGNEQRFVIDDALRTNGAHSIAIAWHFDPTCEVEVVDGVAQVRAPGATLSLRMAEPTQRGEWHLHHADANSMLGWHSPAFGVLTAAPTLIWRSRISGTTALSTHIDIHTNPGRL